METRFHIESNVLGPPTDDNVSSKVLYQTTSLIHRTVNSNLYIFRSFRFISLTLTPQLFDVDDSSIAPNPSAVQFRK